MDRDNQSEKIDSKQDEKGNQDLLSALADSLPNIYGAKPSASDLNDEKSQSALTRSISGEVMPTADEVQKLAKFVTESFQNDIGRGELPLPELAEFKARDLETQVQRTEGISRAQNVCYVLEDGGMLYGAQYTKSDGTYFKSADGIICKVEATAEGSYELIRTNVDNENWQAVKLKLLPNSFDLLPENVFGLPESAGGNIANETPLGQPLLEPGLVAPYDNSVPNNFGSFISASETNVDAYDMSKDAHVEAVKAEAKQEINESLLIEPVIQQDTLQEPKQEIKQKTEPDPRLEQDQQLSSLSLRQGELIDPVEDEVDPEVDLDLIKQRIQKREEERRRRYVVKDKDTLQSIALKQFRDVRLAQLIFEINKHLIPAKVVRGRTVRELKPRMIIFLPTSAEILAYRNSLIDKGADESLTLKEEIENSNFDEKGQSDENIERYVVRLGDTLKSIAIRHPKLLDVSLWQLLGEVNQLSMETDERGLPIAKLERGKVLVIPNETQISQFRNRAKRQ